MRRIIIDTDTGADDAVALIMALKSKDVKIEAITTVAGNVPLNLATKNALMCIEVANGQTPPLYIGAAKPLFRNLVNSFGVHGNDGMGDRDLVHPTLKAETGHAVDAIIEIVENYPDEIELVTIGPATNIALAILKAPETMKKVKHIYSMGTAGFGPGNTTPVAEFNVYVDADAYSIMLKAGIPMTIIGFDLCGGDAAFNKDELTFLASHSSPQADFITKCTNNLLKYNLKLTGDHIVDLADAVAMGVVLWGDEIVTESKECYCYTCTQEEAAYGQVILHDGSEYCIPDSFWKYTPNATVIKTLNNKLYKEKLIDIIIH